MKQPEGLVKVLLDSTAEFGDRDDAAMDLETFDDVIVIEALKTVIDNDDSDLDLKDTCIESLNAILDRGIKSKSKNQRFGYVDI